MKKLLEKYNDRTKSNLECVNNPLVGDIWQEFGQVMFEVIKVTKKYVTVINFEKKKKKYSKEGFKEALKYDTISGKTWCDCSRQNFILINDFIKIDQSIKPYLTNLLRKYEDRIIDHVMIRDTYNKFSGRFKNNFILIAKIDESNKFNLKSDGIVIEEIKNYCNYNSYNLPKKYKPKNNKCYLTKELRDKIIAKMKPWEKHEYFKNIEDEIQNFMLNEWFYAIPTKERPYLILIEGNDNMSYTATFKNKKTWERCFDLFKDIGFCSILIKKYNFMFTN